MCKEVLDQKPMADILGIPLPIIWAGDPQFLGVFGFNYN